MPPKNTDITADQRSTLVVDDDEASIATHFEEAQVTQMDALGMQSAVIHRRTRDSYGGFFFRVKGDFVRAGRRIG
jgi:hypothetical protein